MARFGAERDSADKPEESTSWREWSRRADENRFDADLSTIDSEIDTFGDSAAVGFSTAWDSGDDSDAKPLPEDADDEVRSQRLRNMDRRFSPVRIGAVVLAIVVLIGAAIGVQRLREPEDPTAALEEDEVVLISPGQVRDYAAGSGDAAFARRWTLDDAFLAASVDGTPNPAADDAVSLPSNARVAPLVWGGRAHVAIVGEGVGAASMCVVASLFSAEREVIDVAADGACGDRFAPTGDRVACRGEDVVVLEVWPLDPGVTAVQPDATRVRVRLERERPTGEVESLRVTVDLDQRFQVGLQELTGAPGTTAALTLDDVTGRCQLLDRSDVIVQLL